MEAFEQFYQAMRQKFPAVMSKGAFLQEQIRNNEQAAIWYRFTDAINPIVLMTSRVLLLLGERAKTPEAKDEALDGGRAANEPDTLKEKAAPAGEESASAPQNSWFQGMYNQAQQALRNLSSRAASLRLPPWLRGENA